MEGGIDAPLLYGRTPRNPGPCPIRPSRRQLPSQFTQLPAAPMHMTCAPPPYPPLHAPSKGITPLSTRCCSWQDRSRSNKTPMALSTDPEPVKSAWCFLGPRELLYLESFYKKTEWLHRFGFPSRYTMLPSKPKVKPKLRAVTPSGAPHSLGGRGHRGTTPRGLAGAGGQRHVPSSSWARQGAEQLTPRMHSCRPATRTGG